MAQTDGQTTRKFIYTFLGARNNRDLLSFLCTQSSPRNSKKTSFQSKTDEMMKVGMNANTKPDIQDKETKETKS